jgi:glucose-1-phosphate thymidylyltransferase
LILGDNIFHGSGLGGELRKYSDIDGAQIFGYRVFNPSEYGVVEVDEIGNVISVEEKPNYPKSNYAIPGLYFYDEMVLEYASSILPSKRGELEITAVNECYLNAGKLRATILPRGTAWFDTGSVDSLLDASNYVRVIEQRQNLKIACLEEIAWRQKWISDQEMENTSVYFRNSSYGHYLKSLLGPDKTS